MHVCKNCARECHGKQTSLVTGNFEKVTAELKNQRLKSEKHAENRILAVAKIARVIDVGIEYAGIEPVCAEEVLKRQGDPLLHGLMKQEFHRQIIQSEPADVSWRVAGQDTFIGILGVYENQLMKVATMLFGCVATEEVIAARKRHLAAKS